MLCYRAVSTCLQADLEGLQRAKRESSESATTLQTLTTKASQGSQSAVDYSKQVVETLKSFDQVDISLFGEIQDLIQRGQREKQLYLQMDDMAQQTVQASQTLTASLQRGFDSLPQILREEYQDDDNDNDDFTAERSAPPKSQDDDKDDDDDASILRQLLGHVDKDVTETKSMERGVQQVDIFTAASKGRDAFAGVIKKQDTCRQLFQHLQGLAARVKELTRSFAGDNCCEQVTAMMGSASALMDCLSFSKLIQKAADAARKLIQAVLAFVQAAWKKFSGFLDEFDAAKRLGRFVQGIRPLKNTKVGQAFKDSKVGQAAMDMVGNMLGR